MLTRNTPIAVGLAVIASTFIACGGTSPTAKHESSPSPSGIDTASDGGFGLPQCPSVPFELTPIYAQTPVPYRPGAAPLLFTVTVHRGNSDYVLTDASMSVVAGGFDTAPPSVGGGRGATPPARATPIVETHWGSMTAGEHVFTLTFSGGDSAGNQLATGLYSIRFAMSYKAAPGSACAGIYGADAPGTITVSGVTGFVSLI